MSANVRWLLCAFVAATLPLPALASEGAIEINQVRSLAGGVTTGDAPGFPVTISAPGRYVLTGSLTMPNANTTGIEIQSDDVTLDLNGFRIAGVTTCTGFGATLSCAPQGTGIGIFSSQHEDITVRNGTITGMGGDAVLFLQVESCRIESLTIAANGGNGLAWSGGCDVSGVIVDRNGALGISQNEDSSGRPDGIVRESVISRNKRTGIQAVSDFSDRFAVLRSVVHGNGEYGVDLVNQGTVRDCVIYGNARTGISLNAEGYVRGNAVRSNLSGFFFSAQVGYLLNAFSDHANASSGGVQVGGGFKNICTANPGPGPNCP